MRRIAAVGIVAQLVGCSFALVSGPPPNHQQLPYFDCTTSRVGPVLDVIWTSLMALNTLAAVSMSDAEVEDATKLSKGVAIPLYVGLAAAGGAGMYYGFTRTARCRAAKHELMFRAAQGGGSTMPGPGTWPPPADAPD